MTPEKFVQDIKRGAGWTTDQYVINIGCIDLPNDHDQYKALILLADRGLLFEENDDAQEASDEGSFPSEENQISVRQVEKRHKNLKDEIKARIEELDKNVEEYKELDNKKQQFIKIHENGRVHVYMETIVRDHFSGRDTIFVSLTSSMHWSDGPVRLDFNSRGRDEWDIRYPSGGTLSAEAHEIAEAMRVMFTKAEEILRTK